MGQDGHWSVRGPSWPEARAGPKPVLTPKHPGSWRITEVAHNAPAIAFWRRTIPVEFAETVLPDGPREQRFEII